MADWWEEAKDKSPDELNKLYPPLQPKEMYHAKWSDYFLRRNLDYGFQSRKPDLEVRFVIETEKDIPIKAIYGHLAFVKDSKVIYETQLAEKPAVSFTNMHSVFLRIPYDDDNAVHRTLRFAKNDELTPVFAVSKVVYADGKEKTFE